MAEEVHLTIAPMVVPAIEKSEQIRTSQGIVTTVETGFKIASADDREQSNDTAIVLKRGIAAIEDGLRDAFKPLRVIERMTRDRYTPLRDRMQRALDRINAERARWDRLEEARIKEEAVRAQREADEAARVAKEAASSAVLVDDEEVPGAAQIVVPAPERTTRGALATTSRVRRVKAVELVDPSEAAEQWGAETVVGDFPLLSKRYKAKMDLGALTFPPDGEAGVVVGGVRFITESTYSDRYRGR